MRKFFITLLSAVMAAVLLVACSGTKETGTNDEKKGKTEATNQTVAVGIRGPVLSLDPANHRDRVTESVLRNIFDPLVIVDANGEIKPKIADSWEQLSPTEWQISIKQGIKFHDGSELTAEDVKFSFDRIIKEKGMEGETSPRKGLTGPLQEVQVIDKYTVKFVLSESWPIFLKMLPFQQIIPKAYFEKVGPEGFREKPIGSGAFKFVEGKLDERIVLERFDEYFEGAPKIAKLVFDVIPDNASRIAALQAGEVHRIHAVPPSMVEQLKNDPNLEVKTVDGTRVYMLEMNTKKPPFDNVKVRQAMNHAIDMNLIIKETLAGYGERLAGPMLKKAFGINESLKPYEYNPEKAKQLLAEAGYANGFKVVIDTEAHNKEVAEAAAAMLREIGIDASARVWDGGVIKPMLLKGERQMFMGDWGNATLDPYDFLNPKLKTGDRGNYSLYSNPRVDQLLTQAEKEEDPEKRKNLYKEAQEIIYNDAPWVFGYQVKEIEVGVKQLKGWEPLPDGMLYMANAYLEK